MKSPFLGMDPYIEACGLWEDFHSLLIGSIYRALAPALPRGYTVHTATRSYVVLMEPEGKSPHTAQPDVAITDAARRKRPRKKKGGVAVAEPGAVAPVLMQAFVAEQYKESFVEIHAQRDERLLVACLEVLSPSNKRPGTEGWRQYERKRQALLLGQAHFVEIDLLRGGHKMPMLTPWPEAPYSLLVCRAERAPYCHVWPASFQQPLPPVPVPLLAPDPDLTLDLQPLIDDIYALGRFGEQLDYARALAPPLPAAEAAARRAARKR